MAFVHTILSMLMGLSAVQDAAPDGWELTERDGVVMASVRYSSGQALAVRCREGQVDAFLAGVGAPTVMASYEVSFDGEEFRNQSWLLQDSGISYSTDPRYLARRLATARRVSIRTPSAEGPARRFDLDLPSQADNMAVVMERCGASLTDPRDVLRRVTASGWLRPPRPVYPDTAVQRTIEATVGVSCIIDADGRTEDCRIEMAAPAGQGFEMAALRAARDARVELADPADAGGVASFSMRFYLPR